MCRYSFSNSTTREAAVTSYKSNQIGVGNGRYGLPQRVGGIIISHRSVAICLNMPVASNVITPVLIALHWLPIRFRVMYKLGETGYGCHTFYITDVFRNIVIIADIYQTLAM